MKLSFLSAALVSIGLVCSQAHASVEQLGLSHSYQASTPTVTDTLGYPVGSRISSPEQIYTYFQALAEAHPEQIKLRYYGESWEGRPLFYAIISSAKNIAQLDDFEANMQRLADPRQTSEREAKQLIESMPASVWLSYGVHGNEISSPEAGMLTAYHLLASPNAETSEYLENTVVFIDPLQNPDGRARFVSRYYMTVGLEHSADRISAEHNEPWPNGRSNHYLFDLNRDWLALTQPEIAGQVEALLNYYPLLFIDLHEMGGDMSYYFTPEARPYNPLITESQRESLWKIGENNGRWFDQEGYDYFTREIFDAFYPGYGASWPLFHGTLAATYEMASARGHKFRTVDGDILTYGDGVQRHFIASLATIETAAERRQALLQDFWNYRSMAIELGEKADDRVRIIADQKDPAAARKIAGLLRRHGVDVMASDAQFKACGKTYPAGSYIVDSAQPAHFMVRVLLDQQIDMAADFLAEQEQLRANNLPDQIYDVTAWSLPLMFNVETDACDKLPRVAMSAVSSDLIDAGQVINPTAKVGFIVPWGDMNAGRFLAAALRQGLTIKRTDLAFTHANGQRYPAGSLILTKAENGEELASTVVQLAQSTGAKVVGVDSSWVTDGPNFGSVNVKKLHAPNVAIAWDEPFSSLSAGHSRFVIEQQMGYPTTAIRPQQLARSDLSHYQVLIIPAAWGNISAAFGEAGVENIRNWVNRGGVLITMGTATQWAIDSDLLASAREKSAEQKSEPSHGSEKRVAGKIFHDHAELAHYIEADNPDPYWTSGVLARAEVDQDHWLSAGVKDEVISIAVGNHIYRPLTIDHGRNIVSFAAADRVVASGYLWAENQQQLAHKPLLMWQPASKGMVIAFTQDPNYRAYFDGLNVLLMNAIFGGAAHATPLR
ncbi:M14 family zinc carboxypeptidase [Pseudidiomarina taiwanensis]|uniref:Peptidase M14 n=1 Tax=Pseudidiomarina taiwanensis TaxID=337250 RepID=A0A432ZN30_9GAMM|nr:M14 family zinc carboxypeptidase [Pseudidiomarina taiwanensis]RUO79299.1 peptidase M14 [Pseudidiomarina taiwanensis]